MNSKIVFVNVKLKEDFDNLEKEDPIMKQEILMAFREIQKNAFVGTELKKHQLPREYEKKLGIHNVWKYEMKNSWKIIYSVENRGTIIIAIILEWNDYKNYENMIRKHY